MGKASPDIINVIPKDTVPANTALQPDRFAREIVPFLCHLVQRARSG
jgi:hypothetical protein